MTKVFFSVTMSLDGFIAPPGRMEELQGEAFEAWAKPWSKLQDYVFHQEFFRRNLKIPGEGETGSDNDLLRGVFERTGVTIMGKRMFDAGEKFWPEEAPFHTPVFVVTHAKREPWVRPGGTTFHFVNDTDECPVHSSSRGPAASEHTGPPVCDGIASALREARAACPPDKDIRIGGGGETINAFLRAGLVDEFHIAVSPLFLGEGVRLLDGLDPAKLELEPLDAPVSKRVTHVRYRVVRR